jgi:hypothetical protein
VISGDVHSAWLFAGPADELGPVAAELVAPAVSSTPMGEQLPRGTQRLADVLADNAGTVWADLLHHGYLVVDVEPGSVRADWYWVDPLEPGAAPEHGAAFRVDRSVPPAIEELVLDRPDGASPAPVVPLEDRPGLPLSVLPPPDDDVLDAARRARRRSRLVAVAVVGGVAAALAWAGRRRVVS